MTDRSPRSEVGILPDAKRISRVILAADAFTRYPEDRDAFDELCNACEAITDREYDAMQEATA